MMMRGLFFLLFAVSLSAVHAQQAELAWQFKSGDELAIQFTQSDTFRSLIDTRDRSVESEVILDVDWSVTAVDPQGTATVDQTLTRIRLKSGAPGEEEKLAIEIDTAAGKATRGVSRDFAKLVMPLVGLKYSLQVDNRGAVLAVAVDPAVMATINALPADHQLSKIVQPEVMKTLLAKSLALPAKSLKADLAWEDTDQLAFSGGTLDRKTKWKVESLDDDVASLGVSLELNQGTATAAPGSFTGPMTLRGYTGGGKMVFDRKAGHLQSYRMESEIRVRTLYRTDRVDTTLKSISRATVTKKE